MSHLLLTRRTLACGLFASILGLSACGGGGDSSQGSVAVALDYPFNTTVELFEPFTVTPTALNAAGHSYRLRLTTQAGQATPDWATVDQRTGVIQGWGPAVGETPLTVWLTIDNGANPVNQTISIRSTTSIAYAYNVPRAGNVTVVPRGVPLTLTGTPSGLKAGDTVVYSTDTSRIPPGMTLDPSTGTLSGTPTQADTYALQMHMTVTRNGRTATVTAAGSASLQVL